MGGVVVDTLTCDLRGVSQLGRRKIWFNTFSISFTCGMTFPNFRSKGICVLLNTWLCCVCFISHNRCWNIGRRDFPTLLTFGTIFRNFRYKTSWSLFHTPFYGVCLISQIRNYWPKRPWNLFHTSLFSLPLLYFTHRTSRNLISSVLHFIHFWKDPS